MKKSRYNYISAISDSCSLIYNTASDKIVLLSNELVSLFTNDNQSCDLIRKIHPAFFQELVLGEMLVPDDVNEYENIVNHLLLEQEQSNPIHITINPTLDCNFRCWYCYEEHLQGSCMTIDMLDAIQRLLLKIIQQDSQRRIVISFFGGEPLLYYTKIVKKIITYIKDVNKAYGRIIDFYMTSNGYLLTEKVINDLKNIDCYVDFQIPIDGAEYFHDKIKFLSSGQGTYAKVLRNIKYAVQNKFPVTVRCNYTNDSIESFREVADDFIQYTSFENLEFKFHRVWQEKNTKLLQNKLKGVVEYFTEAGLRSDDNVGSKGLCYADKRDSVVINYNGELYKCTARNFDKTNCIGLLNSDGELIFNDRYYERLDCKYKSKQCADCIIFPICMQTCSQNVIEVKDDICVAQNTPEYCEQIIRKRLRKITNYEF